MSSRKSINDSASCDTCRQPLKPIDPPQPHRRFCSAACRLKAWRKKNKLEATTKEGK